MFKKIVLFLIRLYQHTLSLDHGPLRYIYKHGSCRFNPTCSEYTYQAINKYGVIKGLWLGLKRVLKCRPGGGSGINLLK